MAGIDELNTIIGQLRELEKFPARVAPKVAVAAKADLVASAARGVDPAGKPWQKTKDGRVPLRGAGEAIRAAVVRDTVVLTIEDHHARHHLGAVRGKVKREILPTQRTPESMTRAVTKVITDEYTAVFSG